MSDRFAKLKYSALRQMTIARLREFSREPAAIFWVYVFPILMMIALGVAFRNRPLEQLTVVVESGDRAEPTLQWLDADERFRVSIATAEDAHERLRTGKADLIVTPEESGSNDYRYTFDPTRPGSLLARNATDDALQRAAGREDLLVVADREVSEPGARYIDFLVPGLIGMGIMGGGLWGVGFAIVDMRIRKLLKRFLATPMNRSHFLVAVMISRLIYTIPEIVLLLICARFIFGVINQGSYLTVTVLILLGTIEFSGIGLLVASRAKTLETISGLLNLVMLPMWMASGIFFSYDRFPEYFQPLIRILPLTPLIDALRQTMLEGQTIADLGSQLVVMAVWAILTFFIGLRFFRWN
ncbi:MAG: hypothetical protein CMJ77_11255 [Planctomycetaceae bacterium]|nr:hypothetical protein [Planctomycetaceae bacterium]